MSCRLCHQAIHPLIYIEFKLMFAQIISMAHIHTHEELLHQLMEDTGVFTHFFCVDRNETLSFVTEIYCWYAHLISTHTAHTKHTKQSQLLFPFNEYPIILENFLFWSNLFWDDRRWGHKIRLQSKSDICRFNEMQLYRYNCVGEPQQQQFSLITSENVELNQECTKYKKRRRKQIFIADSFTVVHLSVAAATVFTAYEKYPPKSTCNAYIRNRSHTIETKHTKNIRWCCHNEIQRLTASRQWSVRRARYRCWLPAALFHPHVARRACMWVCER